MSKNDLTNLRFSLIPICFIHRPQSSDAWVLAKPGITQAVAIASFAYMCHHSTFLLYGSLKQPTESRWARLTHASVFTSALIEIFFALFGYATFTGFVQGIASCRLKG
jgi:sodium-coupled neutral amino acid transporter 11